MKQLKTIWLTIILVFIMAITAFAASSGEFMRGQDENGICWQYKENKEYVKNRWIQNYEGNWYYAGEDTKFLKNTWLHDTSGKWYYFGDDWAMMHGTTTPDGCNVGSDGAWVKDGEVVVESSSATEATNN